MVDLPEVDTERPRAGRWSQEYPCARTALRFSAAMTVCGQAAAQLLPTAAAPGASGGSLGGVTVLMHGVAVLCCLLAARREAAGALVASRRIWLALAIWLLLLGLNKSLDMAGALVQAFRGEARSDGWYALRRPVQAATVVALALLALWAGARLKTRLSGHWDRCGPSCTALLLLTVFVLIRSVSLHQLDAVLNARWGMVSLGGVIENGLLLWVSRSAWRAARALRPAAPD